MNIDSKDVSKLLASIQDQTPVAGATHSFYRYPARFSPGFAEAAMTVFTEPGDIVYDPFVGGGTTLVEAMRLGRTGVGTDLNSLAIFVSKVKTTLYTDRDLVAVDRWVKRAQTQLKLNHAVDRPNEWIMRGYQRNISTRSTWPIRKTIELALADLSSLQSDRQRNFVKCLLLKTGQWAVDCRRTHPTARAFREQLSTHAQEMIQGALCLRDDFERFRKGGEHRFNTIPACLHCPAQDVTTSVFTDPPKLILTSPPYPGVHVLYHRWQVQGRRETPAPYWIANCLDGNGASFYTFGDRKHKDLKNYFAIMRKCYKALSAISEKGTWLVQLVAFSSPDWQLPSFLQILQECGFEEVLLEDHEGSMNGRAWRTVPNRRFYADFRGTTSSAKEVLLLHRRT